MRYRYNQDTKKFVELVKEFWPTVLKNRYEKLILTPLERKTLIMDSLTGFFLLRNDFTGEETSDIPEMYMQDLVDIGIAIEYHRTMEEYAETKCIKCKNRENCVYGITKLISGGATCVYFEEKE